VSEVRRAGNLARMGELRNSYKILVENAERKRPLESSRHRWKDNINIYLREIECGDEECIHRTQNRFH
jgi:hypothetical protein